MERRSVDARSRGATVSENMTQASDSPMRVSAIANVPVDSLDRFRQFVPKSQWGMLSKRKWEARAKGRTSAGLPTFAAIAPATKVCAVAIIGYTIVCQTPYWKQIHYLGYTFIV
jgi:hypothetical protein